MIETKTTYLTTLTGYKQCEEQRELTHDDVIKWNRFPQYWPFVMGILWSPVDSLHKRSEMQSFVVPFDVSLNKLTAKQTAEKQLNWDVLVTIWRHWNVTFTLNVA